MPRAHERLVRTLLALGFVAVPAACSGSDPQAEDAAQGAGPSATPTGSPREDGCARVESAIGWTEFMLVPPGQEDEQDFFSGVRGRLAYVEGTVLQYGEFLPAPAVGPARQVKQQAHRIVDLDSNAHERVEGLRHYRAAVEDLEAACGSTANG
ncbi:MAG: hypothetical protein ACRDYU_14335 [Actinomycetes bacterium]